MADDIQVLDLQGRLGQWRQEHPKKRDYVGSRLEEASRGLPRSQEKQIAGLAYSPARRAAGGIASDVPGAASGAPPSGFEPYVEVVCVPFSKVIIPERGTGVQAPAGESTCDDLYVYQDSASGDVYQHTTSIGRILALAKTHPLVATIKPTKVRNDVQGGERQVDDKGRATSGQQSSFDLSLSMVETGKVFQVGLTTKGVRPEFFALHWKTIGSGWTVRTWIAARSTFFDLIELDASHILGEQARGEDPIPVPAFGASVLARPTFPVSLSDEEDSFEEPQDEGGQEEEEAQEASDSSATASDGPVGLTDRAASSFQSPFAHAAQDESFAEANRAAPAWDGLLRIGEGPPHAERYPEPWECGVCWEALGQEWWWLPRMRWWTCPECEATWPAELCRRSHGGQIRTDTPYYPGYVSSYGLDRAARNPGPEYWDPLSSRRFNSLPNSRAPGVDFGRALIRHLRYWSESESDPDETESFTTRALGSEAATTPSSGGYIVQGYFTLRDVDEPMEGQLATEAEQGAEGLTNANAGYRSPDEEDSFEEPHDEGGQEEVLLRVVRVRVLRRGGTRGGAGWRCLWRASRRAPVRTAASMPVRVRHHEPGPRMTQVPAGRLTRDAPSASSNRYHAGSWRYHRVHTCLSLGHQLKDMDQLF